MRVLEINDLGLRLFEGERLLFSSPGCAALDGRELLTGERALARARLDPRRTNDRFWYQLDVPLPAPLGAARTAADLAHAQLSALREPLCAAPLLVAAPASFTPAQLGVLLGVLEAIGARAVGLVDSAVACASTVPAATQVLHVELQLHRVVCTWMEGEHELQRVRVEELKPGFAALQERAAGVIAQAFVRHARFDPLHNAQVEQALYQRLPGWLERLSRDPAAVLELDAGGRTHRVSLTREAMQEALAERSAALASALLPAIQAQDATVLLGDRAARVPGLATRLASAIALDPAACARGALLHAARIRSDDPELPWVTRLPRRAAAIGAAPARATHGLLGTRARPLPARGESQALAAWLPGAPGLLLHADAGLRLEHAAGSSLRVNGEAPGASRALRGGDRIVFDGQELRLIEVAP